MYLIYLLVVISSNLIFEKRNILSKFSDASFRIKSLVIYRSKRVKELFNNLNRQEKYIFC